MERDASDRSVGWSVVLLSFGFLFGAFLLLFHADGISELILIVEAGTIYELGLVIELPGLDPPDEGGQSQCPKKGGDTDHHGHDRAAHSVPPFEMRYG